MLCMRVTRLLLSPCTMQTTKVGSESATSRLKAEAGKTLAIMAETCSSPSSAAEGILSGLQKYSAFTQSLGTRREGVSEILATISPLAAMVSVAKMTVRCEPV